MANPPVSVIWKVPSSQHGICDFCAALLTAGEKTAYAQEFIVAYGPPFNSITYGPWALCDACQRAVGIQPGADQVAFDLLDRRFRETLGRPPEGYAGLPSGHVERMKRVLTTSWGDSPDNPFTMPSISRN